MKQGDKTWTDTYDKLIIATGSRPRINDVPGYDLENIMYAKLFQDAQDVKAMAELDQMQNIAVLGSGYISIELAEAFQRLGKNVKVITRSKSILSGYFDEDFSEGILGRMKEHGIDIHLDEDTRRILRKRWKIREY